MDKYIDNLNLSLFLFYLSKVRGNNDQSNEPIYILFHDKLEKLGINAFFPCVGNCFVLATFNILWSSWKLVYYHQI